MTDQAVLSAEDESAIQELLKESKSKSLGIVLTDGEELRGRIGSLEKELQNQSAQLNSVKQACANQEQVLAHVLEQQRITNQMLSKLSTNSSGLGEKPSVHPVIPPKPPSVKVPDSSALSLLPGQIAPEAEASSEAATPGEGESGWSKLKNKTQELSQAAQAKSVITTLTAAKEETKAQATGSDSNRNSERSRKNSGKAISSGAMKRKQTVMAQQEEKTSKAFRMLEAVVNSDNFSYFFGVLIMANSVCIGLQANFVAQNIHSSVPDFYSALETFFCWAFLVELVCKIVVEGKYFFLDNPGWKWNVFDFMIVILALVEELSKLVSSGGSSINLTFVRILRILRIVRIIRLIRVLKVFRELRVLINSILGSLKSLCWTILLLVVIMYVVAVYVTQVVAEHRKEYHMPITQVDEDHAEDLDNMELMFGSVASTLYSLYKAMSGGADWGDVAQPLEDRIHFLFSPFFCMYIAFAVFAVLNVVTGVFVNEAMVMAGKDQELVIEEELSRKGSDINEFIRMFHEADADGNGKVSWDEFREQMEDDRVKAYFKVLDLNVDEAEQLFVLLDPQVSGEVSIDDFVQGCIRMKGGAKSIDVQTLLWQNKAMMEDLKKMNSRLEIIGA